MKQFTRLLIEFEERIKYLVEELQLLKMRAYTLEDENEKLRTEITTIYQNCLKETGDPKSKRDQKQKQGIDNLVRLYHEGFHVCNMYFGQFRSEEDCLFCRGFLQKRNGGREDEQSV